MVAIGTEVTTIPIGTKLEQPKNWNKWKFQVRLALGTNGLMDIVDGTQGKPSANAAAKDVDAWVAKDIKGQHIIVTRLTDNVTVHVLNCISAREIWKKLHTTFEQKGDTSVHMVQQQFFNLKFEQKMEMTVFIVKMDKCSVN